MHKRPPASLQVAEYYGEFNSLERGKGAVMKESQKVGAARGWGAVGVRPAPKTPAAS